MCLGGVFKDLHTVLGSDCADSVHVEGVAIEVNRHDGGRAIRDLRFDGGRIKRVVVQVHVGEDRSCSSQGHGVSRGRESERRNNDFVAGTDARSQQAEVQAGGA
ncbi:hypothetical protein D3C73_1236340 [compost metagenome]